jgi:Ca-activated chloride channel homolog
MAMKGTLMAVITPAADLQPLESGRDWVFVLDISGSMRGHKISTLANGVQRVLGQLHPNDRFRIVTFNTQATDFTGGYITATPANVESWIGRVKMIAANGGTDLFAGIREAYRSLDEDRTTGIILVTDGVANVGETQHKAFLDLVRKYDLRLFTFVIGNSANQPLMERLARDTDGFAMNISDADDIVGRLMQARAKVTHQALRNVNIRFSGERITDVTPSTIGSLYAGEQAVLFGRYNGEGPVTMTMTASIGGKEHSWTCRVERIIRR